MQNGARRQAPFASGSYLPGAGYLFRLPPPHRGAQKMSGVWPAVREVESPVGG
jgi:hypothetical protein